MVGGSDIQEFEEKHFEVLVEDFCNSHDVEFKSFLKDSWGSLSREEAHGFFNWSYMEAFATLHSEWARFVEIQYATRGAE